MNFPLVINIYGGPGSGKTTLASQIFTELKQNHIEVDLVSEYAKDMILQGNLNSLKHQFYITGTQAYKIWAASERMDVVVVDSPILLGPIYDHRNSKSFLNLCYEYYSEFNNLDLWLPRKHTPHGMNARVHSLTESVSIDNRIKRQMEDLKITLIDLSIISVDYVVKSVIKGLNK